MHKADSRSQVRMRRSRALNVIEEAEQHLCSSFRTSAAFPATVISMQAHSMR
jgi:hypothetical protein